MMADGHDLGALRATAAVWGQLNEPERWVRWSPYQQVVDIARRHDTTIDWCDWFSSRYLDLSPIFPALLDDPNRARDIIRASGDRWACSAFAGAATDLVAYGERCVGTESVIRRVADGDLALANTLDLVAAAQHYESLVEPLKEARRLVAPIFDATDPAGSSADL